MESRFDVIVVGGGHAGCEAAMAASNLGVKVLLISMSLDSFGKMSCNPAIGGIAKGQIAREIDAMGGYMGVVTDRSTLQFRMLNKSKGPAMWSPRAQCDKTLYRQNWRKILENTCNLSLYADTVTSFVFENSKIVGCRTATGAIFKSQALVLTAGTFLDGKIFIGRNRMTGGRIGELPSNGLTEQLTSMGLKSSRMKTGTPSRIDINTVDVSKLQIQLGDENPQRFSYLDIPSTVQKSGEQTPCYLLHTNPEVHDILRSGFADSPLLSGEIKGIGPRYCPSIEDKLRVFPQNDAHQLFLEPQGASSSEYYLQGFSSSLPLEVQVRAINRIEGLENARILKPGYAVEYDFFDPTQLSPTLESKVIEGLFLAGQVNGTTGYEEAGGQGLMAGINAALKIKEKDALVLRRDQSYIGVLIDDLVMKGVDEPYRMFTSRAEYRILLRQDNADERLTELSHSIGLASEERYALMQKKYSGVTELQEYSKANKFTAQEINAYLSDRGSALITESKSIYALSTRAEVSLEELLSFKNKSVAPSVRVNYGQEIIESAEISIKYSGYIDRELQNAEKLGRLEYVKVPQGFDFNRVSGLSTECRQKLQRYNPQTIGQASRISGVSPSDISVLLLYFGR